MRGRILDAALDVLAQRGYRGMTMAAVATAAGISTGNVYRYFESKQALVDAALPQSMVDELEQLLGRRIRSLAGVADIEALGADHPFHRASAELLAFGLEHRKQIVVLLSRSADTRYEGFALELRNALVERARTHFVAIAPERAASWNTPAFGVVLDRIYASFVDNLAHALRRFDDPDQLRNAVAHLSDYHLHGLKAVFERASNDRDVVTGSNP